ncbi:MAG: bifunctional folylpolyglutamate synthase/dihydrofolate synthase [Pedosphaera sp.]|nr:bifunctional folylpolyglutamate synthase/dihydrofolate synthase [Pedosphaera sp.]
MTYSEAIQFLGELQIFGARFGLENIRRLAGLMGNPQDRLRFIHVAGTNGKGSTCAMLESIYRQAGLRVGLFTSPHLVSFRERIQVNRQLISEAEVAVLTDEISRLLKEESPDFPTTLFEVATAMALRHFAAQDCDCVIWETGLGGRLDATNIVTPLASVITHISLEHEQWLGNSLAEIAAEKAGIIKPAVPVLSSVDSPEARSVIEAVARERKAPLTWVAEEADTALRGGHQRRNAGLAAAVVESLNDQWPVAPGVIQKGLESVDWPGRLQLLKLADGRRVLLDGAHNAAGIQSLLRALDEYFPGERPAMILGMLSDKDWPQMCRALAGRASGIFAVRVNSSRAVSSEDLAASCREASPSLRTVACGSLVEAMSAAAEERLIVLAGSLYLVGEALELLQPAGAPAESEKELNEWKTRK